MDAERELDVVVFGATGFAGRLVAEYLAEHAPDDVRIGLAGRPRARMEQGPGGLGAAAAKWPLVRAGRGRGEVGADRGGRGRRRVAGRAGPVGPGGGDHRGPVPAARAAAGR